MSASVTTSASITPKMLNDINMTDSLHKLSQHHGQMTDSQKANQALSLPEDPRTLQLALELSLVGLNDGNPNNSNYVQSITAQTDYEIGPINVVPAAFARGELPMNNHILSTLPATTPSGLLMPSVTLDDRSKKSQNMTECVPVPSSEHVAEIVGRQGCKIKALRAKTNTYIKTPVRGEEPVFVVTGRKEDVNKAKREILSAADHFSLIRASRKPSIEGSSCGLSGNGNSGTMNSGINVARAQSGPPCLPGQITIQVRVPYRVVGLVVGPKGATIKHIQQETQTYIVTPSREKEPIFEVTGLPENVETARKQIEAHIALRTGNGSQESQGSHGSGEQAVESLESSDFATLHTLNTLSQMLNEDLNSDLLSAIYKNDLSTNVNYPESQLNLVDANGVGALQMPGVHSLGKCYPPTDLAELAAAAAAAAAAATVTTAVTQTTSAALTTAATDKAFNIKLTAGVNELNPQSSKAYNNVVPIANSNSNANLNANANANTNANANANVNANTNANANANANANVSAKANATTNFSNNCNATTHAHTKTLSFCPPTSVSSNMAAHASTHMSSNSTSNILTRSCSSASSTASTKSTNNSANSTNSVNTPPELLNIWKSLNDSIDVDEGIGDSPSIWHLQSTTAAAVTAPHCSPSASLSPTDSLLAENSLNMSQKLVGNAFKEQGAKSGTQLNTLQSNGDKLHVSALHRDCCVCNEREVTTALVPCGHNMFCMDCANQICISMESICPICHSIVYHAMRILA